MNAENIRNKYNLPNNSNKMSDINELKISSEKRYFLEHLEKIINEEKEQEISKNMQENSESKFDLLKVYPESGDLQELIKQADDLKKCLDSFRPLDQAHFAKIEKYYDESYTYNSNKIEGNTLTLQETSLILNKGITIKGKSLREHFEAVNHNEAIEYIKDIAKNNINLTEKTLFDIHYLILKSIDKENAGIYRNCSVRISGSSHVCPNYLKVPNLMADYFRFYDENKKHLHPILLASDMHEKLVTIHPFIDGNGRTARLIMNLILLQNGYNIANIKGDENVRLSYYETLEKSQAKNDREPFKILITNAVKSSLIDYLNMIAPNQLEDNKGQYFYEKIKNYL